MSDYRTFFVVVHGTGWSPGMQMIDNPLATQKQAEQLAEQWARRHPGSPYSVVEVTTVPLLTLRAETVVQREEAT